MVELFIMEYMSALGIFSLLLLVESRYPRRKTALIIGGSIIPVMAAVAILYFCVGKETALKVYTLVIHLPMLLLLFRVSRYRGWRLVFQFLSTVLFCTLIHHGAGLLYYLSGGKFWVLALSYLLLSGAVIWFLISFLRPLFLHALLELRRGWWLMCLVMALYYVIIIYMIPGYVGFDRNSTILEPLISLLMVGFYSIIMFLFSAIQKEVESRHSAQLAALQLSSLQNRMEAVRAAENVIRTERHDLRHRLQVVAELISRGDSGAALQFLDAAQRRLDERKEIRWCRPPVLDAVFSSYFDQAKREGIEVEAKIALPDALPVDEGELAVVVANALENAIHANLALPPERRYIRCLALSTPSLMLEFSNPCSEPVTFNGDGLPVARREGHGFGVRSISDFCQKHGAVCRFDVADGVFRLRLIL